MVRRSELLLHKLASREMRSSFEKGAKLWEQDTCINFTRNAIRQKIELWYSRGRMLVIRWKTRGEQKLSLGSGCETVSNRCAEIGQLLDFSIQCPDTIATTSSL
ncbi:hypothetical protein COOONC_00709 [Cooperia oncophora]